MPLDPHFVEVVTQALGTVTTHEHGPIEENQLIADLGLDSVSMMEMIMVLEDKLNTTFSDLEINEVRTLGDLARHQSDPATAPAVPLEFALNYETHPFVAEHIPRGRTMLPLASALDMLAQLQAVNSKGEGSTLPISLEKIEVRRGLLVRDETRVRLVRKGDELSLCELRGEREIVAFSARTSSGSQGEPTLPALAELEPTALDIAEFYRDVAFHGPMLQSIVNVKGVGHEQISGSLKTSVPRSWIPQDGRARWSLDPLLLDGAFQLVLFWSHLSHGKTAMPLGIDRLLWVREAEPGQVDADVFIESLSEDDSELVSNVHFHQGGKSLGWLVGVHSRLQSLAPKPSLDALSVENLPGYLQLSRRRAVFHDQGIAVPYFHTHDEVHGAHSQIDGQPMVNFSSYNYLGLSGHPRVNAASIAAIEKYGTSVSASRLVAGERPLHRQLEQSLADFLGTEDALVMVSGYLTNVTLISHLMETGDLILYDSLSHDSIVRGARASSAARQTFPHNDLDALEERLKGTRNGFRRVLVVVEGAYSMDGDYPDMPRLVELREKYKFWLMVDEAHSFGCLGATGRGIAEHYGGIPRDKVDLWTGTLSKALASCGGFVAGRHQLIDYLKYTVPGFVFSVGIPPAGAAAAQAALEVMAEEPQRVLDLQSRSNFFLAKVREHGLDPGLSQGTPVVPVIVGDSGLAFELTRLLGEKGINTCPIVYPAVKEKAARLRFFLTNLHTEEELSRAASLTAECLALLTSKK